MSFLTAPTGNSECLDVGGFRVRHFILYAATNALLLAGMGVENVSFLTA